MTTERKICWVSDQIHGSIALSQIEKCLISTPEYNRLHNVLQDSTVYLTYPSNRTSRFIHSLGTTHVVAQIFRYSLNSAETTAGNSFLAAVQRAIKAIKKTPPFIADLNYLKLQQPEEVIMGCRVDSDLDDPFYAEETPSRFASRKHCYAYSLALQAVRLAALLHDIGHPPFSHVTENALGELLGCLNDNREKQNAIEKKTRQILEHARRPNAQNHDTCPFHEVVGQNLSEFLLKDALDAWIERRNEKAKYFGLLVKH